MELTNFTFSVCDYAPSEARLSAYLQTDNWDDWFKFQTLFLLVVFDESGTKHEIGGVKIGQFGMKKKQRSPELPPTFNKLDESFFSLGQDDSYYENLNKLGDELRDLVLSSLRDVAADFELFEKALGEEVTKESLLRSVTPTSVRGQFKRLAHGGARLSRYNFSYKAPRRVDSVAQPVVLSFAVEPESNPPTNIHVLIGRNAVGKTHHLRNMTQALVDSEATSRKVGYFPLDDEEIDDELFANLVSVTFSAFDPFLPLPELKDRTAGIKYSYIGLKRTNNIGGEIGTPKSDDILAREFGKSLNACLKGARSSRWMKAIEMLEADPAFKEADITSLANYRGEEREKHSYHLFKKKLSSGHKIVLLTITRLVETVEERTLVLLDEPEAHLHPPLLSAFVRALSSLLVDRNGVAIVATHSPVVLQEVPKSCVWKLRRNGVEAIAERPEYETFGENVGVLTREIFGLEVTYSGFHKLLQDEVEKGEDFEDIQYHFNNELGAEARAIVRALIAARDVKNEG